MLELARSSGTDQRGRFSVWEYEGKRIRVYDSAHSILKIISLFGDEELDPLTKHQTLLQLLFVDPEAVSSAIADENGLIAYLLWEVCGLDITGEHEDEIDNERIFDWEQDASIIKASLFQAYGVPWDELSKTVSFRELTALMGMIPHETPLGQAIYYRTATPPEKTKYNEEEVKRFQERKAFWELDREEDPADLMEQMNARANDAFAAMIKAAERNGGRR